MNCIQFTDEKQYIRDFLQMPKKLYTDRENMEDSKSIRKLLLGTHPLSKYFVLDKFLIYEEEQVMGRFAITTYPDDDTAYLGFFECVNSRELAAFLFKEAESFCRRRGYKRILGPVDASFWLKYRLKINRFDTPPYTGEPYNKEYYFQFFLDNGFAVREHYTSNDYRAIDESYVNEKYEQRYEAFIQKGYRIESPKVEDYERTMDQVYGLLSDLYSDFPIYKHVSLADFRVLFQSYKTIMNMTMTKLAYYGEQTVGFYISVPDYGNQVYHINLPNLLRILRIKKSPERYVMLYMGVDQAHQGLGKAIVYSIMKELQQNKLPSIGALARDGKVTQNYAAEDITDVYEYVLLGKELTSS
ncbi:MAG: hypothetical protein IJ833_09960 [Lachnospiraceae bacterium]|nr:hypothetical protein [Lachnospiraceae bacterium]